MNLNINKITNEYPYDLLLLADETEEGINKYLFDSEVYIATPFDGDSPVGVFCLLPIAESTKYVFTKRTGLLNTP